VSTGWLKNPEGVTVLRTSNLEVAIVSTRMDHKSQE